LCDRARRHWSPRDHGHLLAAVGQIRDDGDDGDDGDADGSDAEIPPRFGGKTRPRDEGID
jgi:hypothetical protein